MSIIVPLPLLPHARPPGIASPIALAPGRLRHQRAAARSCSARRTTAMANSVFSAKVRKNLATTAKSSRDTSWNSRSLTWRSSGLTARTAASPAGRQPDQHAAAVARVGRLGQQALVDQAADLGGDVGRRHQRVIRQSADRHAFAALPVRGADQDDELWRGERHRTPERLAECLQAAERGKHEIERFAKRKVAAGRKHCRQGDRCGRHEFSCAPHRRCAFDGCFSLCHRRSSAHKPTGSDSLTSKIKLHNVAKFKS